MIRIAGRISYSVAVNMLPLFALVSCVPEEENTGTTCGDEETSSASIELSGYCPERCLLTPSDISATLIYRGDMAIVDHTKHPLYIEIIDNSADWEVYRTENSVIQLPEVDLVESTVAIINVDVGRTCGVGLVGYGLHEHCDQALHLEIELIDEWATCGYSCEKSHTETYIFLVPGTGGITSCARMNLTCKY